MEPGPPAPAAPRRRPLARWAPVLAFGAVLGVAALAEWAAPAGRGGPPGGAARRGGSGISASGESCAECHRRLHPLLMRSLEEGAHAPFATCEDCHGSDHDVIFSINGQVSAARCGSCHEKAWKEFQRSRHGQLLREGKMQDTLSAHALPVAGCLATNGCHSVQRLNEDGSVGQCAACHPAHAFSRAEARDPAVCARCHDAADHPAWRTWLNDKHGVLFQRDPHSGLAPSCATCHMPGGSHADGDGITRGVLDEPGLPKPTLVPVVAPEEYWKAREVMVATCLPCHGKRLVEATLNRADEARRDGLLLVEEAARIVRALHQEGLLVPSVADRPPNPVAAGQLVLGGKQIYDEHASRAERLFYDMFMFHWPDLWRSAFHTDSDIVRWPARERLKTDLIEIRAEAERLRSAARAARAREPVR